MEACSSQLGITFSNFPSGACGDAVLVLGTHLKDLGFGEFQYMLGDYGNKNENFWSSHAWLQLDDLVIDITADQFPDIEEKIIVSDKSEWHRNLNGEAKNIADYRIYDMQTSVTLGRAHNMILRYLDGFQLSVAK